MKAFIISIITIFFFTSFFIKKGNKKTETRPNILWITCEDMSPHLGSYGEKVAKTPNLDQLASEGVRYTNVFSTAGVCAPSRHAIITGMYQTSTGGMHMRTSPLVPNFKKVLPYATMLPKNVLCFPEYLRKTGYYCTNSDKQDYQFEAPVTVWDENSSKADWRGRKDKNQPFFSIINLMATHESMVFMNDKKPLLVNPNDVEVPPYLPDNLIIRTDIARFLTNVQTMDTQVGTILQKLKDDGLYDNTIIFFYSDHGDGLPFVKRELYDRGLKVPMIIRYPNAKKANTINNELISFVDLAPTILSLTNIPIPKYMQGQAFLGNQKAKSQRKYIYAARDRMDSEYDRVRAVSDGRYKYLKNYMPEIPYYQNVIYRLQQKSMAEIIRLRDEGKLNEQQMYWFRTKKPNEELFDVKNDPFEFHNLANDPKYKAKLVELRSNHQDWLKNYGDLGSIPENEMVNKWWNGAEKAPKTVEPQIKINKSSLKLNSSTTGASIGYKNHWADKSWKVYSGEIPILKGDSVYAIAQRIGFTKSEIVKFKY